MTSDPAVAYQRVLGSLKEGPGPLDRMLRAICENFEISPIVRADDMLQRCRDGGPEDPIRLNFHSLLAEWDYKPKTTWNAGTPPSTADRRALIYSILALTPPQRKTCDELFPYAPAVDQIGAIVNPKGWIKWYTSEKQNARHFYWDAYEQQLTLVRKWDGQNLAAMRQSTIQAVERLADPESSTAVPTKGLVIGYVQSGKTANFTGVIARAADAGYRLFVVLAGTQNALRDQTQRRIDKELIGKELLGDEYKDSDDYQEFVSHGGLPSHRTSFDWERLTYASEDFKHLQAGLAALKFKKAHLKLPFRHPTNLHVESARLIVVKKNPTSLAHLLKSLKASATHVQWSDVPSLVIDDESDQASVNTRSPSSTNKERTRINGLIVELLKVLRAAQYVGYTATPFANVLSSPDDAEDLFPSDYILPLPRPAGYMGVRDFYDDSPAKPGDYSSNENAFVRSVTGEDTAESNLPAALDAFVLSGALKLYREQKDKRRYKHHTMLVHQSARKADQDSQANLVTKLFFKANYGGSSNGLNRLKKLWELDYRPVSLVQGKGYALPKSFDQLVPFIGKCYSRLQECETPVLILNGDYSEDSPDFDRNSVWRIIVGGAKLSRGYTLEGLTISYYRRRAEAADTLMQMGRWFGYREGYRDLVRLFIGRREPLDKSGSRTIDLYDAFYATCLDEEEFRAQLKRYASLEPGERITPSQVPPLVPSHLLRPTARNKMYNARQTYANYGESEVQRTVAPVDKKLRRSNKDLASEMLAGTKIEKSTLQAVIGMEETTFPAIWCELHKDKVAAFLRGYQWGKDNQATLQLVLEFLESKNRDPGIDRWLMLAPQLKSGTTIKISGVEFSIKERSRSDDGGRYLVYSEPPHILMARFLAGVENGKAKNSTTSSLLKPRQAVLLFYPVLSKEERTGDAIPTMGFVLAFPKNSIKKRVEFSVRDEAHPNAVVVDAPKSENESPRSRGSPVKAKKK